MISATLGRSLHFGPRSPVKPTDGPDEALLQRLALASVKRRQQAVDKIRSASAAKVRLSRARMLTEQEAIPSEQVQSARNRKIHCQSAMTHKSRQLVSSRQRHRPKTAPEVSTNAVKKETQPVIENVLPQLAAFTMDSSDDDLYDDIPFGLRRASLSLCRRPMYITKEMNGKLVRIANGPDMERRAHVQSSISSVSDEYLNQVRKQSSKSQQCDSFAMNRFLPDEETSRIGPVKVPEFSFNAGPQFSISRTSSSMMIDVDKVQEDRKPFVASLLNGPPQSTGAALARRDTLSAQRLTSVRRKSAVMIESMAHILPADFLPEGSFSGTKGLVTADQRPSFTAGANVGTETIESFKLSTMINEKRRMPRQSFAKWDHMAASVAERKLRRGSAFLPIDTGRPIKSEQTYVFTDEGQLITLTPEISVTASSSQLDRADQNGANTEGVAPIISNGSEDSITTPELCSKPSTVPIFERRVSVINARRVSLSQSVGASPENILSKMMDVHKSDDLMEGEGILSGLAKMSFGVTTRQGFKRGSLSAGPGIRRSSLANKSRTQQMF